MYFNDKKSKEFLFEANKIILGSNFQEFHSFPDEYVRIWNVKELLSRNWLSK